VYQLRAGDGPRKTRHRQTALEEFPLFVGLDDLGIDEDVGVFALEQVVDEEALTNTNLWSSEAEARFFVHGLEHVVDQTYERAIDIGDIFGHLLENRIAIVTNAVRGAHVFRIPLRCEFDRH
jgi:hypothetical protein